MGGRIGVWTLLCMVWVGACEAPKVETPSTPDAGANADICDGYREKMQHAPACRDRASPRSIAAVHDECVSTLAHTDFACIPSLRELYECFGRAVDYCPPGNVDCGELETGYAVCASNGQCGHLGGGQSRDRADEAHPYTSFTDARLCACVEDPAPGAEEGAVCETWEDCAAVCCPCPGSSVTYTARACDVSGDAKLARGTCPTSARVCELTRSRCDLEGG